MNAMHGNLRMIALLLLVTMAGTLATAQVELFPAAQESHPAGCHGHAPAIPSPAPTSYQCCVSGHHAAIPNAAFSLRPEAAQICSLDNGAEPVLTLVPCYRASVRIVPSSSPPSAVPLRI
jgi:hypothetical protein